MSDHERTCPACKGTCTGPWDSNTGRREPCGHCDGSGHVVTCLSGGTIRGCHGELSAPEAESEGWYCSSCREALDAPVAAE